MSRTRPRARMLSFASLRWMVTHRAFTPGYLIRYWRFFWLRLRHPNVITEGMVFLGRGVTVRARRGHGRIILGAWTHIGRGTSIRCHEGTLRIGDKCVFGENVTVNCYLDIEFGATTMVADSVYVCDFDHVYADPDRPIKDQGIVKSPVRIGPDVWFGTKATVLRGVRVGRGAVVAAHAVVTRDVPEYRIAAGVPARVVGDRRGGQPRGSAGRNPRPGDGGGSAGPGAGGYPEPGGGGGKPAAGG